MLQSLNPSAKHVEPWTLYSPRARWTFLAILFLVTTANYFDYFIVSVLLEPIKQEFRVSDTMLGLLTGSCFALVYALTSLPIARWADRGNRRTVITVALVGWSVMTAACGFAHSFWQLALARFGVGAVEPGALPPAQSLTADYFPAEKRATAITMLVNGASAVGWLVGVGVGGTIAARYGWREAFVCAGAPGLVLAAVVRLVLREPRCQLGFPKYDAQSERFGETIQCLLRKQSFLFALIGISIYATFAYGVTVFVPSFMIRSLHTTLEELSAVWGTAISVANIAGALFGGWLADLLAKIDIRWHARLPAIACILGLPMYWLALISDRLWVFIALETFAEFVLSVGVPVAFVAVLAVCGSHRRSMASALMLSMMVLFGGTLGPLFSGALSDFLNRRYGFESLRYALIIVCLFLVPAAVAFFKAASTMPRDRED